MADTIAFDAATFDRLIAFVTACIGELDKQILAPTDGLRIDSSLRTYLKPGSKDWDVVSAILDAASEFGGKTRTKLEALRDEWEQFVDALKAAKEALMKGDDMASMSAKDFLGQFPLFGGSTGGSTGGFTDSSGSSSIPDPATAGAKA